MAKNKKYYKPYFLENHADFKNIFYDTDLAKLRKGIKELNEIVKTMELRINRHDTLQIAKSIFDYESQKNMYYHYPHMYYDFRCGDVRICIARKKYKKDDEYFVNVCGFNPNGKFNEWIGHYGYGQFESLEDTLGLFYEIIRDFISTHLGSLF